MDGGIMDGRWEGVDDGDGDGDDLLQFPIPTGCKNGVSGPGLWFLVAVEQRNFFWKNVEPPGIFRLGALYSAKKRSRWWPRRSDHPYVRLGKAWAPRGPLRLVFRLREFSGKMWILQYFLKIFLKVGFM
jgi:hypothetical protein